LTFYLFIQCPGAVLQLYVHDEKHICFTNNVSCKHVRLLTNVLIAQRKKKHYE